MLGLALGTSSIAPETSRGTNRLAWTQGISRSRWLRSKIVVSVVLIGTLAPLVGWWADTGYFEIGQSMLPKVFAITGTVSVGYVLFSYPFGVALGATIRNAGWAFAVGRRSSSSCASWSKVCGRHSPLQSRSLPRIHTPFGFQMAMS
jgi:ABC-type transport system involved in multi-copper enzyme maturation permease subunit